MTRTREAVASRQPSAPRSSTGVLACMALAPTVARSTRTDRALRRIAREHTPRFECHEQGLVVLDVDGLGRLHRDARALGESLRRTARRRQLHVQVAVAATRAAAVLLASARDGVTVVPSGCEPAALASLPITSLEVPGCGLGEPERQAARTIGRWGLATLGELAALPTGDLFERLGTIGLRLHRLARGQDLHPLVPEPAAPRFAESMVLDWPIEGTEPLSFVLGRVLEPLCARLARHDRGVASLHVRLRLVTRTLHTRRLDLPTPLRDPKVLRTLILLDLESHPPPAGIDEVQVSVDTAPGLLVQFSLLERARPAPERLSTLVARLQALMGADRCGTPMLLDSHRPDPCAMAPFAQTRGEADVSCEPAAGSATAGLAVLRRFRDPVDAHVIVADGHPASVWLGRGEGGGQVITWAGPWRSSGDWWRQPATEREPTTGERPEPEVPALVDWDRDEWDVALADGGVYRLVRDRITDRWFVEGVVD